MDLSRPSLSFESIYINTQDNLSSSVFRSTEFIGECAILRIRDLLGSKFERENISNRHDLSVSLRFAVSVVRS